MKNSIQGKPLLMGAVMGPMMLMMLHPLLTDETGAGALPLLAFVGAHVLIVLGLVMIGYFASRFSPRIRARIKRFHRPSLPHVTNMLAGATIAALIVHILVHGGI